VGLGSGHTVLDGDPARLPKKGAEPPIFAHFYCGQMAGWMSPLGAEVDHGPGHCIRRGPSYPRKGHNSPSFWPMSTVATVAHLSYCWAVVTFRLNNASKTFGDRCLAELIKCLRNVIDANGKEPNNILGICLYSTGLGTFYCTLNVSSNVCNFSYGWASAFGPQTITE